MTLNILPILDVNTVLPKPYVPKVNPHPNMHLDGFFLNNQYRFVKKIGAGTYGLIYLVEDVVSGRQYAAKIVLKTPVKSSNFDVNENKKYIQKCVYDFFATNKKVATQDMSLEEIEQKGQACPFLKEISLHLRVHNHPNVVTIHKVLNVDNLAVVILMDYFEQGDLFNNIITRKIFLNAPPHQNTQLLMKNCMLQLVDAISYCSSQSIFHCDLKPENIMVRYNPDHVRTNNNIIDYDELHIVLIDFGLAISLNLICCNACRGSSFYMAPERIVNYTTNNKIKSMIDLDQYVTVHSTNETASKYFPVLPGDVWSLGVLFINIACARNPWPIANINETNQVFYNYIFKDKTVLKRILPISRQFNMLLNEIFMLNPNDRISLQRLYNRLNTCDFFHDAVYKEGLYTPPESDEDLMDSSLESFLHFEKK